MSINMAYTRLFHKLYVGITLEIGYFNLTFAGRADKFSNNDLKVLVRYMNNEPIQYALK